MSFHLIKCTSFLGAFNIFHDKFLCLSCLFLDILYLIYYRKCLISIISSNCLLVYIRFSQPWHYCYFVLGTPWGGGSWALYIVGCLAIAFLCAFHQKSIAPSPPIPTLRYLKMGPDIVKCSPEKGSKLYLT